MIEVGQSEDEFAVNWPFCRFGHMSGLLCRRDAQNVMRARVSVPNEPGSTSAQAIWHQLRSSESNFLFAGDLVRMPFLLSP